MYQLTAHVTVPSIASGIRPAFFSIKSNDPPSMYSIQILISPSLDKSNNRLKSSLLKLTQQNIEHTCKKHHKIQQYERNCTREVLLIHE